MTKALELAKFGRETPPTGVVVGDSDAQTLSSKTFSDGPVFSGLNANGIPYLNASKVLSSSSTFVFDGTNVGLGIASPAATLHVNASGGGTIRASRSSVGGEYVQLDHDGTDGTLRVSGNNKLYLTTNGSTRVTVNGSGDVGIGTAPSSNAKLQVTGYTDFWNSTNTLLRVQHDGTRGRLQAYTGGAVGNIGINSEGGSVGIGTDTPVRNFTVYAATNARMLIQNENYNGAINKGLDLVLQSTGEAQLWNYQNNYLAFGTNNQERVYISAAGKVGIGTSLPTEILTISHSDYQALGIYRNLDYNSVGAMGVRMYFGGYVGSTATASAAIDGTLMTATTGRLSLSNLIGGTLTESLRIDTNGSIRIGGNLAAISATNEKLTVDGGTSQAATLASSSDSAAVLYLKNKSNTAATIQPYLYFNDADGGNRGGIGVKITDASTHQFAQGGFTWYTGSAGFSGPKLILTDIGRVAVGTTTPWAKFQVTHSVNNTNAAATNFTDYQNAGIIIHNQDDAGTGNKAGLFFAFAGSPGILAGIDGYKEYGNWNTGLRFYTNNQTGGPSTGTLYQRMCILPNGNVGIANSNPAATLHVVGTGSILAGTNPALGVSNPSFSGLVIGFDGSPNTAQIVATNPSTSQMAFYTKPNSGSAPIQRLFISYDGIISTPNNNFSDDRGFLSRNGTWPHSNGGYSNYGSTYPYRSFSREANGNLTEYAFNMDIGTDGYGSSTQYWYLSIPTGATTWMATYDVEVWSAGWNWSQVTGYRRWTVHSQGNSWTVSLREDNAGASMVYLSCYATPVDSSSVKFGFAMTGGRGGFYVRITTVGTAFDGASSYQTNTNPF